MDRSAEGYFTKITLTEDDITGASLRGKTPSQLTISEIKRKTLNAIKRPQQLSSIEFANRTQSDNEISVSSIAELLELN